MEDQCTCFELGLGVQVVAVHARFPRDLFLPNDGSFVIVRDCRVVNFRYCGAMESQVSLMSRLIFARQQDKYEEIVVPVLLIVHSKEEDVGDDGSDFDQVGVGWLDGFDLKVFSSCFKERIKFFRWHGVRAGLLDWS